jgi:hypothetical protein
VPRKDARRPAVFWAILSNEHNRRRDDVLRPKLKGVSNLALLLPRKPAASLSALSMMLPMYAGNRYSFAMPYSRSLSQTQPSHA